jgi:hypothetical protein
MFLEMIKLGVANLGEGKIKVVLADRGFFEYLKAICVVN